MVDQVGASETEIIMDGGIAPRRLKRVGEGRHAPKTMRPGVVHDLLHSCYPLYHEGRRHHARRLWDSRLVLGCLRDLHSRHARKVASISICARSTLLYVDLFSSDRVRIGCNSSIVGSLIGKFDERTILVMYKHGPNDVLVAH